MLEVQLGNAIHGFQNLHNRKRKWALPKEPRHSAIFGRVTLRTIVRTCLWCTCDISVAYFMFPSRHRPSDFCKNAIFSMPLADTVRDQIQHSWKLLKNRVGAGTRQLWYQVFTTGMCVFSLRYAVPWEHKCKSHVGHPATTHPRDHPRCAPSSPLPVPPSGVARASSWRAIAAQFWRTSRLCVFATQWAKIRTDPERVAMSDMTWHDVARAWIASLQVLYAGARAEWLYFEQRTTTTTIDSAKCKNTVF